LEVENGILKDYKMQDVILARENS